MKGQKKGQFSYEYHRELYQRPFTCKKLTAGEEVERRPRSYALWLYFILIFSRRDLVSEITGDSILLKGCSIEHKSTRLRAEILIFFLCPKPLKGFAMSY